MKVQFDLLQVIILLITLFYSCESSNKLRVEEFDLKFDAGILSLKYPVKLDTIYNWIDMSDCTCCHESKIRLSKSSLENVLESGFIYTVKLPDTINQITIIQSDFPDCNQGYSLPEILEIRKDKYRETYIGYAVKWFKKEIEVINGKSYSVIGLNVYDGSPKKLVNSVVELMTLNNNEWIRVEFKCQNDFCQNYTEEALKLSKSINLN